MLSTIEKKITAKPFLKWAGGKRQILPHLLKLLPKDIKQRNYWEPFLGGGALFFALDPVNAVLSDANMHLIMTYKYVRDDPELVFRYLSMHMRQDCESYYYKVRDLYNKSEPSSAQAARFIFLNKACYNGIFRVNQKGLFNVPYGRHEKPSIPSISQLKRASKTLRSKDLMTGSYEKILKNVKKGDFIYLDPPYPPLNGTSHFTYYTTDKFGENEQQKLAETVKHLDAIGCLFMLSNAATQKIKKLYKRFVYKILPVTRFITCKKIRHEVKEIIVRNY